MNKRKRIKLECEECGSQFDDDYKARHEKAVHGGKKVKIKHVGAPLNLFEASKRKATVSVQAVPSPSISTILVTQSPSLSFTAELPSENVDGSTIIDQLFITKSSHSIELYPITESSPITELSSNTDSPLITVNKVIDELLNVKVNEKVDIEKPVVTKTSETINDEDESFSWMSCAGQVTAFLTNFERVSDILTNIKTVAVPNPRIFVIEIIDCLSKIHKECEELLHYARKGERLEENEEVVVTENELIDHDPGKRKKRCTFAARPTILDFSWTLQPKMTVFPTNESIPLNKQRRFKSYMVRLCWNTVLRRMLHFAFHAAFFHAVVDLLSGLLLVFIFGIK